MSNWSDAPRRKMRVKWDAKAQRWAIYRGTIRLWAKRTLEEAIEFARRRA